MTFHSENRAAQYLPAADAGEDRLDRPLIIIRLALPFLLLATLAVALIGCAGKETYPPGSFCLLTDTYLDKLFDKERTQTQEEQPASKEENI